MLSILIPIYNQDVRPLVYALSKQCIKANINYQILCFDDGSEEKWRLLNKELAFKINVNYTEVGENMGRSRIRNYLGRLAYYPNLLFIDGDSTVKSKNFVQNYVDHLPTEGIVAGGTAYSKRPPTSKKKYLHWLYGSKHEALAAKDRNKDPFLHFHSNNFVVAASVFEDFKFDDQIKGYGYEDTVYANQLKNHRIEIKHIDNPLVHDGLEINTVFLEKMRNAMSNLATLHHHNMIGETRLIKFYNKLLKFKGLGIFEQWMATRVNAIEENLCGPKPSMTKLQLLKLYLFIQSLKSIQK